MKNTMQCHYSLPHLKKGFKDNLSHLKKGGKIIGGNFRGSKF